MYNTVLFDLDGTLTESGEGIVRSVEYALEKMGFQDINRKDLLCFVGPPLIRSFMKFYDLSREKAVQAVGHYRDRFGKVGIFENRLYPGILEMLRDLKKAGYRIAVASGKPEEYIARILDHFAIAGFFDVVTGSLMDGRRTSKDEVIEECLARLGMAEERDHVIMVGDRDNDILGARHAGLDCIGVLYGYGSRKELESAGPLYMVETVEELAGLLLREYQPGEIQAPIRDLVKTEESPAPLWGDAAEGGDGLAIDFPIDDRLKKQLAFSLEIDKEKTIFRQTHLSGKGRRENDAEHAWHMALMAYLFREYANEEVDISRVMLMCLIHDIVEIDAGDTYAYDEEGMATQKAREDAARDRIFSLLPEDQKEELAALFDEFEACRTPESQYAHAMDNLQPLLLNNSNCGGDWREHGVTSEQIYRRQEKTRMGSEKIYEFIDKLIQKNIRQGNIKP